jgi:hypothetical protein
VDDGGARVVEFGRDDYEGIEWARTGKGVVMTDEELKDLVASLSIEQKETARQIRQVNKQMGELGNKFSSFAEGMALPSMEKILYQDFGMDIVSPRAKAKKKNGRILEIDVLAIVAAVDIPDNMKSAVLKQGLYLARISGEAFKLQVPRNFKPKAFTANGARSGHKKAK